MAEIRITEKLIGTLSETYYKEHSDQNGWAYVSLEQIHENGIKNGILKFKKGFDRIFIKIPEELISEIEEISKPTNESLTNPSYVYDFLACNVINVREPHLLVDNRKKWHFVWVEVKTGYSNLTTNQINTSKKISLRLFRIRVPCSLAPADEMVIYKDEVNSKFLREHQIHVFKQK